MLPDGIEGGKLVVVKEDAWGTELKYEINGDKYIVRSAGSDKQFDTPDDIKSNERQFETELKIGEGDEGMPSEGPVIIPPDATPTPEVPDDAKPNPEDATEPGEKTEE
jgi:hypothetical protein